MSEDRRRFLMDVLDEFDHYFDEFERSVQDSVRSILTAGGTSVSKPIVAGVAMGLTPEGKPSVQFFGDKLEGREGYRTPIYEQLVDEKEGTLRLVIEMPGVEKEAIDISAQEEKVVIHTKQTGRKYDVEIPLTNEIDPESGRATYSNGVLDTVFQLRQKTNKGYRRVSIV
jgi:HSP20 family protein